MGMNLKIMLLVALIINAVGSFFNMIGVLASVPALIIVGGILVGIAFLLAMGILIYILLTT
jgi:hypothetical protein